MRTLYKNNYGYGLPLFEAIIRESESLFRLDRYIKVLILAIALISLSAVDTYATHFRYGNVSWKQIDANTVEFQVAMVFRSDYFFGGLPIGKTFTPDLLRFYHGDGTSRTIQLTVTSRSISDNWSYAEGTFTKTYANPGNYTAYLDGCCRLSTLVNNRDGQYQIQTLVNVGTVNTSPVSSLPPIINLPVGVSNASFVIPASDPDGDVLSFSITPSAQMGTNSNLLQGLSINANSGIATFSTVGRLIGQLG